MVANNKGQKQLRARFTCMHGAVSIQGNEALASLLMEARG
jgi:hypothetical protein